MTGPAEGSGPALQVEHLDVHLGAAHVLRDVSVQLGAGRTLGLVGESGSGKSTLAKALVGLVHPSAGAVRVLGHDPARLGRHERDAFRRRVQLVPQDPFSSLSPRRTVGQTLAEAIDPVHADPRRHRDVISTWLQRVHLDASAADRYPHEFSGGQRQRIAIARALVMDPAFVIADEITSALDVSVQAQVLDLIAELRASLGLTMVFISHNLAVVQQVSDDLVVLYRGEVVEAGPASEVYTAPRHPYTRRLLDSVPGTPGFSLV